MEEQSMEGWWWLPNHEENKVAGTMTFSDEHGLQLKLFGAFKELTELENVAQHPRIFGVAGGKLITLFNCLEAGSNLTFPGALTQRFMASVGCIGGHPSALTEQRFRQANIRYNHLAEWSRTSGFETDWDTPDNDLLQFRVQYSYPDEVQADTRAGMISISYGFEYRPEAFSEIILRESLHFRVEPKEVLLFDDWLRIFVRPLQNFLTLATRIPNYVVSLQLFPTKDTDEESTGNKETALEFIFQQNLSSPQKQQTKVSSPFDMLFALPDIREGFSDIVDKWLEIADELDSVCNLFFSLAYRAPTYLENRFLPLVQAAESYHRRRRKNEVLSPAEHGRKIESILEHVPTEHKEWLLQKLNYSNEPSLRKRLKELVDETEGVISPLIGSKQKFVDDVVNTRNYLTHFDEELQSKAARGADLFRLAEALSVIVEACLLGELGLTGEIRTKLFHRNQRYTYAVKQARSTKS
ncbi:MAG: hypothetical protein IH958_06500 [Chloroflexi bacterium]|nr:hypothetical protein [Chloroflexota bacterium]